MKIAVISDVHGNLPALEAAVADAAGRGARRIYCAGDAVGYGPFPSGVCAFLEHAGIGTISGNYDRKAILAIDEPRDLARKMKPGKWRILDWTRTHIDAHAEAFLRGLPDRILERLPGGRSMLIVHGSPASDEDTICCGHTHIPFSKRVGGILAVNAGSAGFPVDGDPRPSYALLDLQGGRPSCRIVRFAYPVDRLVEALSASSLPKSLCRDFAEGNKKREAP
jgi:putative phosphoesterase